MRIEILVPFSVVFDTITNCPVLIYLIILVSIITLLDDGPATNAVTNELDDENAHSFLLDFLEFELLDDLLNGHRMLLLEAGLVTGDESIQVNIVLYLPHVLSVIAFQHQFKDLYLNRGDVLDLNKDRNILIFLEILLVVLADGNQLFIVHLLQGVSTEGFCDVRDRFPLVQLHLVHQVVQERDFEILVEGLYLFVLYEVLFQVDSDKLVVGGP